MWNANIFALTLCTIYVILLFWLEGRFYQQGKQVFTEFLCRKMYKNNCLNCLKIYVRIFIQCININCRNFQIIQKTFVLYRFKSLNFSKLKWKSVKRVFFIFRGHIYRRDAEKIFNIFFIFLCIFVKKMFLNFEIWFWKTLID